MITTKDEIEEIVREQINFAIKEFLLNLEEANPFSLMGPELTPYERLQAIVVYLKDKY